MGYKRFFSFRRIFNGKIGMEAYFDGKSMGDGGQKKIY